MAPSSTARTLALSLLQRVVVISEERPGRAADGYSSRP